MKSLKKIKDEHIRGYEKELFRLVDFSISQNYLTTEFSPHKRLTNNQQNLCFVTYFGKNNGWNDSPSSGGVLRLKLEVSSGVWGESARPSDM